MTTKLSIFLALVGILCAPVVSHADPASSPKVEMQKTIDGIITIASAHPGDGQQAIRRSKLRELINPKRSKLILPLSSLSSLLARTSLKLRL
jgi:hypothetical protein